MARMEDIPYQRPRRLEKFWRRPAVLIALATLACSALTGLAFAGWLFN